MRQRLDGRQGLLRLRQTEDVLRSWFTLFGMEGGVHEHRISKTSQDAWDATNLCTPLATSQSTFWSTARALRSMCACCEKRQSTGRKLDIAVDTLNANSIASDLASKDAPDPT